MARKKVHKSSRKTAKQYRREYNLTKGNSNEFLLILGGGAFVIFSVLYLFNNWLY